MHNYQFLFQNVFDVAALLLHHAFETTLPFTDAPVTAASSFRHASL